MKKKTGFIIIPVIIIAIIGIWFLKNGKADDKKIDTDTQKVQTEENVDTDINETEDTEDEEADFFLEATGLIDYESLVAYGLPIIVDYGWIPVFHVKRWLRCWRK